MIISTCNRTEIYFEFENHVGEENKFLHSIVKDFVEFKRFKDSLSLPEQFNWIIRCGQSLISTSFRFRVNDH